MIHDFVVRDDTTRETGRVTFTSGDPEWRQLIVWDGGGVSVSTGRERVLYSGMWSETERHIVARHLGR